MKTIFAAVFALVIGVSGVFAQEEAKTVEGGILNPRAATLPLPEYPESAKQARAGGLVAVDVVIDEFGVVTSAVAEPYDQHERKNADGTRADPVTVDLALREAAEAAARQATFKPVILNGRPAKVRGRIIYNFVADNSNLPPRLGEIYGPLLNGKAIELPQPVYPDEARAANVSGTVTVHVAVDENGNVTSATATSGPPLLRAAAEEAAMKAKFKPTLLAGQPVPNRGVLTYTFATTRKIQ